MRDRRVRVLGAWTWILDSGGRTVRRKIEYGEGEEYKNGAHLQVLGSLQYILSNSNSNSFYQPSSNPANNLPTTPNHSQPNKPAAQNNFHHTSPRHPPTMRITTLPTTLSTLLTLALSISVSASPATPLSVRQGTCDLTTAEYCPDNLAGCKAFVSITAPHHPPCSKLRVLCSASADKALRCSATISTTFRLVVRGGRAAVFS
ncbi:hypothetical protein K491DRAFT_81366 [Lophiostoma macrostomum CBS 122681]|uniref:Uncharacterized protein n=1 Tax=Lophiostoma macrostomum CBS 122681 TaxID=1314788 RepID=A0A6A6TK59_9PLEO|nr:hypothetical protein K491DRAFT_81366 [Lophiostoma macrostomum CBS 122681]